MHLLILNQVILIKTNFYLNNGLRGLILYNLKCLNYYFALKNFIINRKLIKNLKIKTFCESYLR